MIRIITTGGTIEGLEYETEEDRPALMDSMIPKFLDTAKISFEYTLDKVFSKDSRFITSEDRKLIRDKINGAREEKILITHGTLTMVETAIYLGELNLNKTIVLVGSFVLGTLKNTDAPFNLGFALSALSNLGVGVYIAMHGTVFGWNEVVKNQELNRFERKFF